MFNISLLLSAAVIIICVLANKLSNKIGMPVLIAFIALGMVFGSDGILKIPFLKIIALQNRFVLLRLYLLCFTEVSALN